MSFTFSAVDKFEELPSRIQEYLPTFFNNRWEDFLWFEKALQEKNFEVMRDYCHKQVGVATCYNCFKLYEITRYIQTHARAENYSEIKIVYPSLRDYLLALRGESK